MEESNAEAYQNGAKLNYIHPPRFNKKSLTDPFKG